MAEYARAMRWDTDGNTERAVCRAIKEVGIMVTRGRVTGSRLRQARRRGTRTKTRVTVSAVATTGFAKTQTLLEHALSHIPEQSTQATTVVARSWEAQARV